MSHLCLSCALCCDGTFFPEVRLAPEEAAEPLEAAGAVIFSRGGADRRMVQGCAALRDCTCAVYEQRPAVCRAFQCSVLKQLERAEIDDATARSFVETTQRSRDLMRSAKHLPTTDGTRTRLSLQRRVALFIEQAMAVGPEFRRDHASELVDAVVFLAVVRRFVTAEPLDENTKR